MPLIKASKKTVTTALDVVFAVFFRANAASMSLYVEFVVVVTVYVVVEVAVMLVVVDVTEVEVLVIVVDVVVVVDSVTEVVVSVFVVDVAVCVVDVAVVVVAVVDVTVFVVVDTVVVLLVVVVPVIVVDVAVVVVPVIVVDVMVVVCVSQFEPRKPNTQLHLQEPVFPTAVPPFWHVLPLAATRQSAACSHIPPSHPEPQLQTNELMPSTHAPRFEQVWPAHSLMLFLQSAPFHPAVHVHVCVLTPSLQLPLPQSLFGQSSMLFSQFAPSHPAQHGPALVSVLALLWFEQVQPDAAPHDSDSVRLCSLPHPLSLHPPKVYA